MLPRPSIARFRCVTALLAALALAVAFPGGAAALPDLRRPPASDGAHPPHACAAHALALCPAPAAPPHRLKYSRHARCVLRRRAELPFYCQDFALYLQPCLAEIEEHCQDLREHDTLRCLDDRVTAGTIDATCASSVFLRSLHAAQGRDIGAYRDAYRLEEERAAVAVAAAKEALSLRQQAATEGAPPRSDL